MFIFSAQNLTQAYRRLRFVREYATYQRAQGKLIQEKQQQIDLKKQQLQNVRGQKNTLLAKDRKEHADLQNKQAEQQKVVESLKHEQQALQGVIAEQRKKQQALNAQIDRLVAIEIQKARERAAAEAKARKIAEEKERKRKAEEAARKKAAAEAAAREQARRVAEAKEREAKAKAEAKAAAEKADKAARERAEQRAREAEAERIAAEKKEAVEKDRAEKAAREEKRESESSSSALSSVDRELSGSFANNRGRLPMPVNGRIISHYGQYNVEGLTGVQLSNNGINIKASAGATVRSVFAGEVSAVFGFSGTTVVMVRHGAYISVYCNLATVHVSRGQKVSARQALGTLGTDGVLQFQLRKETAKLNPEPWLGR